MNFLSKDSIVAEPGYNRWRIVPAALGIHLCIGSVYAWSVFNPALVRQLGVVASADGDWTLRQVVGVFTVAIVVLGMAAALAGNWLERAGPRRAGLLSACCWGGGLMLGGAGIATHELWLLYLGYGVLGGCGLGLGYVSPVSTLIRWFPDRRGMATGLAIMGFGGGAIIGAPMIEALLQFFYVAPERVGAIADIELTTEAGRRFAEIGGQLREVVVVSANAEGVEQAASPGVYLVGTGSTGAAAAFVTLGAIHLAIMLPAALAYRVPRAGWTPAKPAVPARAKGHMSTPHHVHIDQALKTRQFYQLWLVLCLNVTAGIGILGVAGTMMTEIFGQALPETVTAGFVAMYVAAIGGFNMAGRFVWATASDYLGRRNTYWIFFAFGILLYNVIPFAAGGAATDSGVLWLALFCAATFIIFSMYGGGFATIPAYLADVFGTRYVGGIHGRLLTAWSVAGIAGPLLITSLRERAIGAAINDLVSLIDPLAFTQAFGGGMNELAALVEARTVTIASLMPLVPPGTPDPTPGIYDTTMYALAGLLCVALVCNALMGPVDAKHHLPDRE